MPLDPFVISGLHPQQQNNELLSMLFQYLLRSPRSGRAGAAPPQMASVGDMMGSQGIPSATTQASAPANGVSVGELMQAPSTAIQTPPVSEVRIGEQEPADTTQPYWLEIKKKTDPEATYMSHGQAVGTKTPPVLFRLVTPRLRPNVTSTFNPILDQEQ